MKCPISGIAKGKRPQGTKWNTLKGKPKEGQTGLRQNTPLQSHSVYQQGCLRSNALCCVDPLRVLTHTGWTRPLGHNTACW